MKGIILTLVIITFISGCQDKDKLNESTDSSLLIINTVENAQALLDNTIVMRETPGLGELSCDDYYVIDSTPTNNMVELNTFLWKTDIFQGQTLIGDWTTPYRQLFFANSILHELPKLSDTKEEVNAIEGSAKFVRAYALLGVVLQFANLYSSNANVDLGIPIRLTPDPEIPSSRATVQATYNQIINDLVQSLPLLPVYNNKKNRPSKAAAYALLARVYLTMADYAQSGLYSDSCLQLHNGLINYNNVDISSLLPFSANNDEVIYQSNLHSSINLLFQDNLLIDTVLYHSYKPSDLRKAIYFKPNSQGKPVLKPGYTGNVFRFSGLATDEILLIRAESNARLNNKEKAMDDLNALLVKRWKAGDFVPLSANTDSEALNLVLEERRRSLVGRGLRWIDIRRFNRDSPGINLKRIMNGKEYTLPAKDNRFILPIPPDVISSVQGMPQNPR